MDYQINRRKFAVGTSAFACSLLINRNHVCLGEERSLAEKRLILLGLYALARAPERSYFADGHRGAAMISAHLMCVNNQFDDAAAGRIVELFDLHWAPSALCKQFPKNDPVADATERVCKALAGGGGVLREVGHDAIFAMHAIKAFRKYVTVTLF